ncbi:MAG: GIY-YIG nuclease family protein [Parcubacteria group bacterium]|nr:GIY-YIG nuclease family protein [Parcubacteria group bacterium]
MQKYFYVYIATNFKNTVLYTGISGDLARRMSEHKSKQIPGFTAKYNVDKLVYYDTFPRPIDAIAAEKKIKGWTRKKKIALIKEMNPDFNDLSQTGFSDPSQVRRLRMTNTYLRMTNAGSG